MIRTQQDKEKEQRIFIEAIVDCYYGEERDRGNVINGISHQFAAADRFNSNSQPFIP